MPALKQSGPIKVRCTAWLSSNVGHSMKLISKSAFHRQFAQQGIVLDRRFRPPQTLIFEGRAELRQSWDLPGRAKDIARWVTSLVDATQPEKRIYLYPRDGAWRVGNSLKLFQTNAVFAMYGLKPTGDEVVEAEDVERDAVESLVLLSLMHGSTVADDIFLIPDHGKVILYADHHEAMHGEFGDGEFMNRFLLEVPETT